MRTGLTSITFRQLAAEDVIAMAAEAGLDGIEWGGDVHAPPGEPDNACNLASACTAAGLDILSYGSYYRCDSEDAPFALTLETAVALGAPVVRVWAGRQGSREAGESYRSDVVTRLQAAASEASAQGVVVGLEYHGGTLTDSRQSAHQLLDEVGSPNLKLYWQPRTGGRFADDLAELETALPHLAHVHAFHWNTGGDGSIDRRPLAEGVDEWRQFLRLIARADGERAIILEFVRDDDPRQFRADAATLRQLVGELGDTQPAD